MVRTMWKATCVVIALAGMTLPGCVTASEYYELEDELAKTQSELAYMRDTLEKAEQMLTDVDLDREDIARLQAELAAAQQQNDDMVAQLQSMRSQAGVFEGVGLTVAQYPAEGLYGYRAEGDVFFTSGSDQLTTKGKKALDMVVAELKKVDAPIRIDGHTDIDPVKKTKEKYPAGNIELGAKRAISVREYLISKGIPASRIAVASFAEHRPVVNGKTAEAKAKNRRVEIMLQMVNTTVTNS